MANAQRLALKLASILWIIWGLVHAFAGIMVISSDAVSGFQAIGDAVNPAELEGPYHALVAAVLNQHAWNLFWFGIVTIVGAVFIWRSVITAIWVTAMVGGLADLGYFMFIDLGGYAKFFPGTLMTIVSATAIILSFWVWFSQRKT